jgi:hypothetical protein
VLKKAAITQEDRAYLPDAPCLTKTRTISYLRHAPFLITSDFLQRRVGTLKDFPNAAAFK